MDSIIIPILQLIVVYTFPLDSCISAMDINKPNSGKHITIDVVLFADVASLKGGIKFLKSNEGDCFFSLL